MNNHFLPPSDLFQQQSRILERQRQDEARRHAAEQVARWNERCPVLVLPEEPRTHEQYATIDDAERCIGPHAWGLM